MSHKGSPLSMPIKIGEREAKNRFVINAMECCDGDAEGNVTEKTAARYKRLFEGQAGVVFFESITVQYDSRARDMQLSLQPNNMNNIRGLEKLIKECKEINPNTILIVQLNHSGEVSGDEFSDRVCVKPLYGFGGKVIDAEYVDQTIEQFIEASHILYNIGADGVDLKFCHGYFGSQILRPYNDRDWKYGGSWENRSRFAFDMTEGVRKVVNDPKFLVGSKVSMYEGFPGGQGSAGPDTPVMDLTESIDLCKGLEERGANFILESMGAPPTARQVHMPDPSHPDDCYRHFTMAKIIKDNVKPETVVMGSAYSVLNNGKNHLQGVCPEWNNLFHWGNYNIDHNYVDMIAIGRQSLADPYLPQKYIEDRDDEINWCVACNCCGELINRQCNGGCVVYNREYAEILKKSRKEFAFKLPY